MKALLAPCLALVILSCGNGGSSDLSDANLSDNNSGLTDVQRESLAGEGNPLEAEDSPQLPGAKASTEASTSQANYFGKLNTNSLQQMAGVWQLYKRKAGNEAERMITENYYIELKQDYSFSAKNFDMSGSGAWVPYYNVLNADLSTLLTFITPSKGHNGRDYNTIDVKWASINNENGATYLVLTDLKEGDVDHYLRRQ